MFSDRFTELCKIKGVNPSRACIDMGLSRTLAAKWKAANTKEPSAGVLVKMSEYFEMPINEILETKQKEKPFAKSEKLKDEDIKFALFDGDKGITDAQFDEVKRFAQYVRERDKSDKMR